MKYVYVLITRSRERCAEAFACIYCIALWRCRRGPAASGDTGGIHEKVWLVGSARRLCVDCRVARAVSIWDRLAYVRPRSRLDPFFAALADQCRQRRESDRGMEIRHAPGR